MISELFTNTFLNIHRDYPRQMYPPASDRTYWDNAIRGTWKQQYCRELLEKADKLCNTPIPQTLCTDYMRFMTDGNRTSFEHPYFLKRKELGILTLAYTISRSRHYLNPLINRLASVLEETFWCVPAHNTYHAGDPFPEPEGNHMVDLFAAGTARVLAEVYQLVGGDLEEISPNLVRMLRNRVLDRVVYPTMSAAVNKWWLSGENNWTVWCARNVLAAGLVFLDGPLEFFRLLNDMNAAVDRYIGKMPDDGYCDEGPNYWTVAGAALLMYADVLESAFPGSMTAFFQNRKIRNIGEEWSRCMLCRNYVFDHADSPAKSVPRPGMIYRIGTRLQSNAILSALMTILRSGLPIATAMNQYNACGEELIYGLLDLTAFPGEIPDCDIPHSVQPVTLFASGQSAILRNEDWLGTIKGGHNAENHNHNDLGHVSVYHRNAPVLLDLGTREYVRQTFGIERYTIEHIRGDGHNAPRVDGMEQQVGKTYTAVLKPETGEETRMVLNMEHVYPQTVPGYERILSLTKDGVQIDDEFTADHDLLYYFYTNGKVEKTGPDSIRIETESGPVAMTCRNAEISAVEPHVNDDAIQKNDWGETMTRLVWKAHGRSCRFELTDGE